MKRRALFVLPILLLVGLAVMFAVGRMPGWAAQWREMRNDNEQKIARPRQVYVGPDERDYVGVDAR